MPAPTRHDPLQIPAYPLYLLISPDYAASLRPPPSPPEDDAEMPDEVARLLRPELR